MFSSRKQAQKEARTKQINTIIGQGTVITGTLTSTSSVRIDGEWQGDLKVEGTLTVGKEGKIKGEIEAQNVLIEGQVEGNIFTKEHLHLSTTSKVNGDIQSSTLEIETGAYFEGKSIMRQGKTENEKSHPN